MIVLPEPISFQWDKGNVHKNVTKHLVTNSDVEEVFYDKHKKLFKDRLHSGKEERLRVIGKTKNEKLLFIVFTIRDKKVRVISARNLNKKEVYLYEKKA